MNNSAGATLADDYERRRRRDRNIGEYVREEPLTSLAIAGGVGFILGGGATSRIGLALLSIAGRIAMRGAATSFIMGLVTGNHDSQRSDRSTTRGGRYRNGHHDNARTDLRDSN